MNDDYDSCLCYDQKKIHDWLRPLNDTHFLNNLFDYINKLDAVPDIIKAIIPEPKENFGIIKQLPKENINELSYRFKQYIKDNLPEKMNLITELIQKEVKFACFSENIGSPLMWGHYAENGTGFALGYDFRNGALNNCPSCDKLEKEWRLFCSSQRPNFFYEAHSFVKKKQLQFIWDGILAK